MSYGRLHQAVLLLLRSLRFAIGWASSGDAPGKFDTGFFLSARDLHHENPASKMAMTGKRLLKRFLMVFLMTLGFFVFINAVEANATPVQPRIRKFVAHSAQLVAPSRSLTQSA